MPRPRKLPLNPLFDAIREDGVAALQRLLQEGADPNARNADGWSALMVAALHGNPAFVRLLLDSGADATQVDADGNWTALHVAATADCEGAEVEVIGLLLSAGASLEARAGDDEWSPLMEAAHEGGAAHVSRMLSAGADCQARSKSGLTALMLSVWHWFEAEEKVRVLLEAGSDPTLTSNDGLTALDYALDQWDIIREAQRNPEIFERERMSDEELRAVCESAGLDLELAQELVREGTELMHAGLQESVAAAREWPRVLQLLESAIAGAS